LLCAFKDDHSTLPHNESSESHDFELLFFNKTKSSPCYSILVEEKTLLLSIAKQTLVRGVVINGWMDENYFAIRHIM